MLRLPDTPALDARARVECIDDAPSEDVSSNRRRGNEAVAGVYGERAHEGSGDDVLILLREHEHALAESIPLLNGEHQVPILALHGSSLGGTHPPRHSCPGFAAVPGAPFCPPSGRTNAT